MPKRFESFSKMQTLDHLQGNFPPKPKKSYLDRTLMPALSSADCFNASFWTSEHSKLGFEIDMDKVYSFFMFLNERCTRNEHLRSAVRQALDKLTSHLPRDSPSRASLRVYLMVPFCDCLEDVKAGDTILHSYLDSLKNLHVDSQRIIVSWLEKLSREHFQRFVKIFRKLFGRIITYLQNHSLTHKINVSSSLRSCAWLLEELYKVNGLRKVKLNNDDFYVPQITSSDIETVLIYCHKDSQTRCQTDEFHFCHYPFLYDTKGKTRLLRCHNALRRDNQSQDRPLSAILKLMLLFSIICYFYLPLCIQCDHYRLLFPDALLSLFHCSVILYFYGLLGIFGVSGAQLCDAYCKRFLPVTFPLSRYACLLFCSFPFLGYFGFIGFPKSMVLLLIISASFLGFIVLLVKRELGMHLGLDLLPFPPFLNVSDGTLCLLCYVVANAFCWWKSTFYILHTLGVQAFCITLFFIGFLGLILPRYYMALKITLVFFFRGLSKPCLRVSRDSVLEDTIRHQRSLGTHLFKGKLQIEFIGENDTGPGVDRDYFSLLVEKLLDPDLGLFSSEEESGFVWFQRKEDDSDDLFYYAGLVTGLAVNNSYHFGLPLPLAVFKKLMDVPVNFKDLKELKPVVARNLEQLLASDGADDWDLTFQVDQVVKGETVTHDLCEDGQDIPVTDANKQEYVNLLVDFYLNKDKQKEYDRFSQGFRDVFDVNTLELYNFQPFEFQRTVVGEEEIDFKKLERNVTYDKYHKNSRTILIFWKIVHSMTLSEGKAFLRYLTGSERMPHTGLKLTIHPLNMPDDDTYDLMPVAITCSHELYLPDIPDPERLRDRLFSAINGDQSFNSIPKLLGLECCNCYFQDLPLS